MNTRPFDDENFDHEPPSADVMAGEYVLGVLDASARRAAETRMAGDAGFAARVQAWEQSLSPLIDEIAPVDPPAHVWPRVRSTLGFAAVASTPAGLLHRVGFWRAATAFATAAAVAAIVVGQQPADMAAPPPVVAVEQTPAPTPVTAPTPVAAIEVPVPVTMLAADDGTPGWLAAVDAKAGVVHMTPVPHAPDAEGRVAELWVIAEGQAPVSLGLVSMDSSHSVRVPQTTQAALVAGSLLAITMEPQGGAPEGKPTGPIVAKGGIEA